MTYASKTTFCLNYLKILRPEVKKKNLMNLLKNFCEFPHRGLTPKPKNKVRFK